MKKKKAAPKKVAKKKVKKVGNQKPVTPKNKVAKKPAKKPAKKVVKKPASKDTILKPIKVPGLASVRSVDDPGTASEGQPATVKPYLDPETGVLTMVPDVDD